MPRFCHTQAPSSPAFPSLCPVISLPTQPQLLDPQSIADVMPLFCTLLPVYAYSDSTCVVSTLTPVQLSLILAQSSVLSFSFSLLLTSCHSFCIQLSLCFVLSCSVCPLLSPPESSSCHHYIWPTFLSFAVQTLFSTPLPSFSIDLKFLPTFPLSFFYSPPYPTLPLLTERLPQKKIDK